MDFKLVLLLALVVISVEAHKSAKTTGVTCPVCKFRDEPANCGEYLEQYLTGNCPKAKTCGKKQKCIYQTKTTGSGEQKHEIKCSNKVHANAVNMHSCAEEPCPTGTTCVQLPLGDYECEEVNGCDVKPCENHPDGLTHCVPLDLGEYQCGCNSIVANCNPDTECVNRGNEFNYCECNFAYGPTGYACDQSLEHAVYIECGNAEGYGRTVPYLDLDTDTYPINDINNALFAQCEELEE